LYPEVIKQEVRMEKKKGMSFGKAMEVGWSPIPFGGMNGWMDGWINT
jgi:hypothetical protein